MAAGRSPPQPATQTVQLARIPLSCSWWGKRVAAPPLYRGWNAQRLAVFRDRPPRDLHPALAQQLDQPIVGVRHVPRLALDQLAYPALDRFGSDAFAGRATRNRGREEVAQLESSARRGHELVARRATDRALMHVDGVGDVAQHQWP